MTLMSKFVTGFHFLILFFSYFFFSLDVFNAMSAIIVHVYIFIKVWNIAKTEFIHLPKVSQERAKKMMLLKLLVPCLIIASYVLFNVTAVAIIVIVTHIKDGMTIFHVVAHLLIILGWISDSFIYVFAQRNIRKRLLRMCRCDKTNRHAREFLPRNTLDTDCQKHRIVGTKV